MNSKPSVKIDTSAQVAYVQFSSAGIAKSCELGDDIILDFDGYNRVIGIEILDFDARIPFADLSKKYHVPSDVVDYVRIIQPTFRQWLHNSSFTNDAVLSDFALPRLVDTAFA